MPKFNYYEYIATELLLGKNSPEVKKFSIYKARLLQKVYKNLYVAENTFVNEKSVLDTVRTAAFPDKSYLTTSHVNFENSIAKIVTYVNKKEKINLSDVLFSDEEIKSNDMAFFKVVRSKIRSMAILVKSLTNTIVDEVPLIMTDFPNIVGILFIRAGILKKEN